LILARKIEKERKCRERKIEEERKKQRIEKERYYKYTKRDERK
jgi:hypothetical protein